MGEVCWCVIMCDLLAGCSCFRATGRVAGWVCLGVFPTWCSKAGADTGSICNRTSFNGHVFYFILWVFMSRTAFLFFTYEKFFSRCVTLLVVMRTSGGVVTTHLHCHFSLCLSILTYVVIDVHSSGVTVLFLFYFCTFYSAFSFHIQPEDGR